MVHSGILVGRDWLPPNGCGGLASVTICATGVASSALLEIRRVARLGARSVPIDEVRGKQPQLKSAQQAHLAGLWRTGKHPSAELAGLFSVARSTVYRAVRRAGAPKAVRAARRG